MKIHRVKELHLKKKEEKINQMNDKQIMDVLKDNALPVYGTKLERENRLRKAWGKSGLNFEGKHSELG